MNKIFHAIMKDHDSGRLTGDNLVYTNKDIIVAVYVDDLRIIGKTLKKIKLFKTELGKNYIIKDLGELTEILDLEFRRN